MYKLIKLFSGLLITIISFSCSPSTELTDIYSDEAFAGKEIKKILVLGMTTDEWKKKVYENEFRSQLLNYNVEVLTAWQELPKGEQLNKETFEKYFKDKNVDAVLVAIEGGESTDKTLYTAVTRCSDKLYYFDPTPSSYSNQDLKQFPCISKYEIVKNPLQRLFPKLKKGDSIIYTKTDYNNQSKRKLVRATITSVNKNSLEVTNGNFTWELKIYKDTIIYI